MFYDDAVSEVSDLKFGETYSRWFCRKLDLSTVFGVPMALVMSLAHCRGTCSNGLCTSIPIVGGCLKRRSFHPKLLERQCKLFFLPFWDAPKVFLCFLCPSMSVDWS